MIEIVFRPVVLESGSDDAISWFTALSSIVAVWLGLLSRRAIGAATAAVAVAASAVVMAAAVAV